MTQVARDRPYRRHRFPAEALALLRGISGIDIVGGDVVEGAPAQIGAQMLFELLRLAARNSRFRNREMLSGGLVSGPLIDDGIIGCDCINFRMGLIGQEPVPRAAHFWTRPVFEDSFVATAGISPV